MECHGVEGNLTGIFPYLQETEHGVMTGRKSVQVYLDKQSSGQQKLLTYNSVHVKGIKYETG